MIVVGKTSRTANEDRVTGNSHALSFDPARVFPDEKPQGSCEDVQRSNP